MDRPFLTAFTLGICLATAILGPLLLRKHYFLIQNSIPPLPTATSSLVSNLPICERNPFLGDITLEELSRTEAWALHHRLRTRQLIQELSGTPRDVWEKLLPPIPNGCEGHSTRVGGYADGSKLICGLNGMVDDYDCIIFSLGSHGDWTFETEILNLKKNCRTITFDCTGDFSPPSSIADRASFHKICYGLDPAKYPNFQSINGLMQVSQVNHLNFLKMDIEMGEWEYFEDMFKNFDPKNSSHLPDQIVVEVHWDDAYNGVETDLDRLAALVDGWYDVGYRIIMREINLSGLCPECYEVTLLRVRC